MDFVRGTFGEEERPRRDVMQVCMRGHVITSEAYGEPENVRERCPQDGTPTIMKCSECNAYIPGAMHYLNFIDYDGCDKAPKHCDKCGKPFPWTTTRANEEAAAAEKAAVVAADQDNRRAKEALRRLFDGFDAVARQLRKRRQGRPTLDIDDEYDVQDMLHALLRLYFDDIRPEEPTPSHAGKASRMDFLLKAERKVIETKMGRKNLTEKELGDELNADIARYAKHPDCEELWCFVYDPRGYIANPRGIEVDLSGVREGLGVQVLIRP